jgi:glycosyltransferase involved in cell wall biosynthesis
MKISIVIPVYNEEKFLPACLKSLFDQVEKPKEVIIVDNNSTDQTVALAKKFRLSSLPKKKTSITGHAIAVLKKLKAILLLV